MALAAARSDFVNKSVAALPDRVSAAMRKAGTTESTRRKCIPLQFTPIMFGGGYLLYCQGQVQMEYRLGDVIDDHCIKCRRLTNHSVVSIVNDEVAKVRCRSCYH